MASASAEIFRFEQFEIDLGRGELREAGRVVPVEPQVFDLLALFASQPGRVLSRDEIIDAVWSGRVVSDSAISTRINAARQALGDDGQAQRLIRTAPRRGYMFSATVERIAGAPDGAGAPASRKFALPGKPSVAVLPFENMSGDPDQTYFSDGITDDIITELSRYDELFVIARHSSFAYRDRRAELPDIADALGVKYILQGSVRRSGERIRVTAQLSDAKARNQVWAERYDRDLKDIFAVQDEIAGVIVNTLAGQLARRHSRRASAEGPEAIDAYDHCLRAMELLWSVGPRENLDARVQAERAVAIDPGFARAHAMIAWTLVSEGSNLWADDPAGSFQRAYDAAVTAVGLDDREPWAHAALGWAHIWRDRAHERGLTALRRSIELNPSSAHFRSMLGWGLGWAGRADDALRELEIAMRLNPHHPALYRIFLGRALFHLRRFDEALLHLETAATSMSGHANAMALTAACYAALGRTAEAQAAVQQIVGVSPSFTRQFVRNGAPYAKPADLEFFVEMLGEAGLPE